MTDNKTFIDWVTVYDENGVGYNYDFDSYNLMYQRKMDTHYASHPFPERNDILVKFYESSEYDDFSPIHKFGNVCIEYDMNGNNFGSFNCGCSGPAGFREPVRNSYPRTIQMTRNQRITLAYKIIMESRYPKQIVTFSHCLFGEHNEIYFLDGETLVCILNNGTWKHANPVRSLY